MPEQLPIPTGLTLANDEKVLWYGRRSWVSLWGYFLLFILTIWIIIGVIFLIAALIDRYGSEYAITNKRIYSRYGLISRRANDTSFKNITDTQLSQGVFGRLLNYGNVGVNTAGSKGFEVFFIGVNDPKSLLGRIQNTMEKREFNHRKEKRIERLRDRYYSGEITREQLDEAIKKIQEE